MAETLLIYQVIVRYICMPAVTCTRSNLNLPVFNIRSVFVT